MKYKVGDRVRILESSMIHPKWHRKIARVTEAHRNGDVSVSVACGLGDAHLWLWDETFTKEYGKTFPDLAVGTWPFDNGRTGP